ncbi:MAG: hypothetical protein WCP32_04940 [Bacteroidota bacterium]
MKRDGIAILIALCVIGSGWKNAFADPPLNPPPLPGNGHGVVNNQQGAPLDGGVGILLIAGTLYASGKILRRKKAENQEDSTTFANPS